MLKQTDNRSHQRKVSTKTKSNAFVYIVVVLLTSLAIYAFNFLTKPEVAGVKIEKINEQTNTILEESESMKESSNEKWWLNSGGRVFFDGRLIETIQGELPLGDKWRREYESSNPLDTDNGHYPQNIFRLVTTSKWQNFTQQVYFKVTNDNLSKSPNRGRWSGVFLLNRYLNGNNLYYTGVRVDGAAGIKKKIGGVYYTLAYKKIFPGVYNRTSSPNLLPHNEWLGLKGETSDLSDGKVGIRLFMKEIGTEWRNVLTATDSGTLIRNAGYGGIRTDFMDVEFDDYRIEEIK